MQTISELAKAQAPAAVELRRTIHAHPELSFAETETAALVCRTLDKLSISYQSGVAGTGVVAHLAGGKPGRTLLLRADMDALPVDEPPGCAFASQAPGRMHACGHDAHVAILLGTAAVLAAQREMLAGNVTFVFQPGEEDTGGAKPMMEAGCMQAVDACAALHVMPDLPTGHVRVFRGAVMACPDEFDLTITGRGGHGAYPDQAVDPIVIAAHAITAIQTLAARYVTPLSPKVISVCAIEGGSFFNVIPDQVTMKGTVRAFDEALRAQIPALLEEVVGGVVRAFGGAFQLDYRRMFPPLINDPGMADLLAQSAAAALGPDRVTWGTVPSMAGDDFSYFAQAAPSVYFHLGCDPAGQGEPLHSPRFTLDEACIGAGIKTLAQFACDYLSK